MANTKKYIAPSLREALEKIKQELGEHTLVVGHKKVRVGGVFGFGAKEMVEVSVIVEKSKTQQSNNTLSIFKKPSVLTKPKDIDSKSKSNNELIENEVVTNFGNAATNSKLAARAYALAYGHQEQEESFSTIINQIKGNDIESNKENLQFSYKTSKKNTVSNKIIENNETSFAENNNSLLLNELKRLEAEMKEIKFSLATSNQNIGIKPLHFQENNLSPQLCESPYYEAYLTLLNVSIEPNLARRAIESVITIANKQGYIDSDVLKVATLGLSQILQETMFFAEDILSLEIGSPGTPSGVVFVGPTGVGKTTTIAKLAAIASLRAKQRVELITLDTYRIAAVEQLKSYAEIIGAGFHVARTAVELNALKCKFSGKALILIDTAGRSPNDLADQMEFSNYLRNDCDLLKCLVLQATTHPLDAKIAIKKFGLYRPDQLIITKLDETTRPGATIGVAMDASLPLAYLCNGQRVPDDLEIATPNSLASNILRSILSAIAA